MRLKHCKLCGGEPELKIGTPLNSDHVYFIVECPHCLTKIVGEGIYSYNVDMRNVRITDIYDDARNEATQKWNDLMK